MLAFSDIVDFLLGLLRDDDARTRFEHDPQGTLARAGLDGVTGQDIRDARLQLADSGAMCTTDAHQAHHTTGADPVHEIGYTTTHYAATEHARHDAPSDGAVDHPAATTIFNVDDRDTLFFSSISDNDVTVTDNSVAVNDAFNQDNSRVTAIQANNSDGAFSSDDDVVAIQDNDVNPGPGPITVDTGAPPVRPIVADPAPDPAPDRPDAAEADLPDAAATDHPPEIEQPEADGTPDLTPDDAPDVTPDDSPADDVDDVVHA